MGRIEEMMYQVPTPLPGEHAVSIAYRWFNASQYTTLESLMEVKKYKSKLDSPRRLWIPLYSELAQAFSSKYSLASFICKFTNINDYNLFFDESVFDGSSIEVILQELSAFKFNNALNVSQDKHWRYCPVCAHEDEKKHGTSYLHVAHQRFYKRVCSKHEVLLEKVDSFNFSLPPTCSEPAIATQSDIDKDAALLEWVTDLYDIPKEERKVRVLNLLRQKVCVYYFEWGKLTSGHYPMDSSGGLMRFLEPEIHFHPMLYLMLLDLFLKRDALDMSMEYRLNMSNVRRELPIVVAPLGIYEFEQDSAA